jgi:acetyltransferase
MDRTPSIPPHAGHSARYRVRRVRPSDADALARFYAALSPESRQRRFLSACSALRPTDARHFCEADHHHRDGFVALARVPDGGIDQRIVGHLCLEPAGAATEEVAVVVADAWQRQGIGRALFERALDWSRRRGIRRIVATAFSWNAPVLRLLSSAPDGSSVRQLDGGVVAVVVPIPPVERPRLGGRAV